jgi:hypothetical protein
MEEEQIVEFHVSCSQFLSFIVRQAQITNCTQRNIPVFKSCELFLTVIAPAALLTFQSDYSVVRRISISEILLK